ncbi:MAG: ribosome-associated translation inhibitor RaiA [Alphaproteobacteria bacterium]|nr:MAG: ribosome-associated translation inhibitor RaiA [Alphaproteobacteria bacterium]
MALKISGKNVDIGQALRSRIDRTVAAAVQKYFDGGYSGHVTVTRNGRAFRTECSVHLDTGMVIEATGNDNDANISFDQALERLQKRLRRYKRRLKDRSRVQSAKMITPAAAFVLTPPPEDEELAEDYAPAIVAETTAEVKTLSVSGAVMELDLTDAPVVLFRNSSHGGINVVYRRPDGHFGWIDPALLEGASTGEKD